MHGSWAWEPPDEPTSRTASGSRTGSRNQYTNPAFVHELLIKCSLFVHKPTALHGSWQPDQHPTWEQVTRPASSWALELAAKLLSSLAVGSWIGIQPSGQRQDWRRARQLAASSHTNIWPGSRELGRHPASYICLSACFVAKLPRRLMATMQPL